MGLRLIMCPISVYTRSLLCNIMCVLIDAIFVKASTVFGPPSFPCLVWLVGTVGHYLLSLNSTHGVQSCASQCVRLRSLNNESKEAEHVCSLLHRFGASPRLIFRIHHRRRVIRHPPASPPGWPAAATGLGEEAQHLTTRDKERDEWTAST